MGFSKTIRIVGEVIVALVTIGIPFGIAIFSMTLAGLRMTDEGIHAPIEAYILGVLIWIFAAFITRFVAEEIHGSIKAI